MSDDKKHLQGPVPGIPVTKRDHIEPGIPGGEPQQYNSAPQYPEPEPDVATPQDFAPKQQTTQPPTVNPLLDRIRMPGETFTLPSGGVFYEDGELDASVENAEVRVYPMTAIDEICIKTPDMLFSGKAVEEVFARCIPQVLKPMKLLAKDVDFLLVCLRKVSYGQELEVTHQHWGCSATKENSEPKINSYLIDVNRFIRASKRLDPTTAKQMYTTNLPNGQIVQMSPIRFGDFVKLMQTAEQSTSLTPDQQAEQLYDTLKTVIRRVDEISDPELIKEWLRGCTAGYLKQLNTALENTATWGPDLMFTVNCKDCNEVQEVTAPLNPLSFFT